MKKFSFLTKSRWVVTIIVLFTLCVNQAWGAVPTGWSEVTSLGGIAAGDKIIIVTNDGNNYFNGTQSSGHFQVTALSASAPASASAAGVIELVSTGSSNTYKLKLVSTNKYVTASAAKSGSGVVNSSSDASGWTFSYSSGFNARYQKTGQQAYCRSYNNNQFRTYGNTSSGATFKVYKYSSVASHTLSWAVSPAASGTVSLSATTVQESSTATATASPAAHYTFTSWSISGTGSTLSSTTTNPTTVTMGTANTTVTATFTAVPKASITLSEAGATTTDETTYYVGDTYELPTSTEATCNGKVLVGWSIVTIDPSQDTKPSSNFYEKGAEVTLGATQTFYAVFATASAGGTPTAYTAGDEGDFVIASKVDDDWYALPTNPTVDGGKVTGESITVNTSEGVDYVTTANASGYTWTIADATYGQTLSDGSKYIYHSNGGTSGTNLAYGNSTTFTWDITYSSPWLTFKGMNSAESNNSRGMLFNGSVFGGYSLGNADESSYYHIRVLPISDGTTYSGYTTSCSTVAVTSLEVSPTSKGIVPGETFTITPTVSPDNATDKSVTWSSGTPATATVSEGTVTGVAAGTSNITCTTTDGGKTATTSVTVYAVEMQARDEDNDAIAAGGPGKPSRTGATITPDDDVSNYVFQEWAISGASLESSVSTKENTITNPTGAVTVTAKYYKPRAIVWKVNNVAYTPASSGGTNGSSSVAYNTAWSDLTLPTPPDVGDYCGQKFVGWTTTDLEEAALNKDVPADATRIAGLNLMTSDNQSGKSTKITAETTTFHAVFADYTTE